MYNFYNNILDNILDSNIDNIVDITNPYPAKQTMSTTQLKTLFNVLLLLRLFSEAASIGSKNCSFSAKRNILPKLLPNIMLKKPSNPLFRSSDKNSRLRKKNHENNYILRSRRLKLYYGPTCWP